MALPRGRADLLLKQLEQAGNAALLADDAGERRPLADDEADAFDDNVGHHGAIVHRLDLPIDDNVRAIGPNDAGADDGPVAGRAFIVDDEFDLAFKRIDLAGIGVDQIALEQHRQLRLLRFRRTAPIAAKQGLRHVFAVEHIADQALQFGDPFAWRHVAVVDDGRGGRRQFGDHVP